MNIRVGSAPDSWGVWFPADSRQTPWSRYLDELVEAGYQWTELGPLGYLPTDGSVLEKELKARNLSLAGGVVMRHLESVEERPSIEQEVDRVGGALARLNARFLVLIDDFYIDLSTGRNARPQRLDPDGWRRLIETTSKIADRAKRHYGLKVAFHPHAQTHVESEDQIEAFLAQTDPERVSLCLDTGHHAYCGGDPVGFFRRHHQRIEYLHIKSVDDEILKRVNRDQLPFGRAVAEGVFCEPAAGTVDFLSFRDLLKEVNFDGWAIAEQDMYPAPFEKPLPIARRTRKYLRDIGIG